MIITQSPLRISFVGGGTDLPDFYKQEGGAVLSTTIDKYIFVILKKRFDDQIRAGYTKTEIVSQPGALSHELIRETLRYTGISKGVEVVTVGDVPGEGTGLGTSSALTVGLLNAFYTYLSQVREPVSLASDACDIEISVLGKPSGKQDQYATALGGLREFVFSRDDTVSTRLLCLKDDIVAQLGRNLMLFFSGITRSSSTVLVEQKRNTTKNLALLRRMKAAVPILSHELEMGNTDVVGEMLHENWELKKELAKGITSDDINDMYNRARDMGALGGKIAGAGGGGFLLLYVPIQNQAGVRQALKNLKEVPIQLEPTGSKILLDTRRPQ